MPFGWQVCGHISEAGAGTEGRSQGSERQGSERQPVARSPLSSKLRLAAATPGLLSSVATTWEGGGINEGCGPARLQAGESERSHAWQQVAPSIPALALLP